MSAVALLLMAGLWLAGSGRPAVAQSEPESRARVAFSLNLADVPEDQRDAVSAQIVRIFLERLLGLGLPGPDVVQQAVDSIGVTVPPEADLDEVVTTLSGRGLVEFRERDERAEGWKPIVERGADGTMQPLTSAYFTRKSVAVFDPTTRQSNVSFELNEEGALLMEAASRRLIDKPIGIFYDDQLVVAPVVRSILRDKGVIAVPTIAEAKRLAVQLNSGALPVDVTVQP
jgi:preprotein translocase subunit SecD